MDTTQQHKPRVGRPGILWQDFRMWSGIDLRSVSVVGLGENAVYTCYIGNNRVVRIKNGKIIEDTAE